WACRSRSYQAPSTVPKAGGRFVTLRSDPARKTASSSRIDWWDVPSALRRALESFAGAAVTSALTQEGGYSDGLAARLCLADGSRLFVKGMPVTGRASTVQLVRREAEVLSRLPSGLPAPRLIGR